MRHLAGLILAAVVGLVLFEGAGWGTERVIALHAFHQGLHSRNGEEALVALAGTGLLIGIVLAAPRISPLAAVLPGLGLLAWSAYWVGNATAARRLVPMAGQAAGMGFTSLLASGILAMVGSILVIPLFVPSRWRRRRPRGYDGGYGGDAGYGGDYYGGGDDTGYSPSSPEGLLR